MEIERHLIVIHNDANGKWQFTFTGPLPMWKKCLICLVGWEVTTLE